MDLNHARDRPSLSLTPRHKVLGKFVENPSHAICGRTQEEARGMGQKSSSNIFAASRTGLTFTYLESSSTTPKESPQLSLAMVKLSWHFSSSSFNLNQVQAHKSGTGIQQRKQNSKGHTNSQKNEACSCLSIHIILGQTIPSL